MKFLIFTLLIFNCSFAKTKIISPKKHIIQSAFFPGLGQYKMGEIKRSKNFFFIESALILFSIDNHLRTQRNIKKMNSFSANHAGVNILNKNNKFILDLSNHLSTSVYNENQLRLRLSNQIYINENYQWEWDDITNMKKFNSLNKTKNQSKKLLFFALGTMISNRIISIIDVNYLLNIKNLELSFQPVLNKKPSINLILNF